MWTPHAAVDLSGYWLGGSAGEPNVPRIVVRPPCNYHPAVWVFEQHGDTLRAWSFAASQDQGVPSERPMSKAGAVGRVSGLVLTLRMGESRYLLRYDSTSGHLRGTLDGKPFWAVREEIVRPTGCIGVP